MQNTPHGTAGSRFKSYYTIFNLYATENFRLKRVFS